MTRGIFITGTGTDVGKTYITALIVKKLRESGINCGYFKAAMSGCERGGDGKLIPGDALHVKNISGTPQPLDEMCPYVYENAVSPHLAAKLEKKNVELDIVKKSFEKLCGEYDFIAAEGSGGIMCPIRYDSDHVIMLEDVIKTLDLPCLIVADAGLGTINSVTLTVSYMRSHGLDVKGVIFNHFHKGSVMEEDNLRMCRELANIRIIACACDGDGDIDIDVGELVGSD
ncbi:MAG: dethiobiotin synthase [Ruminococcus sp.]|nr:dethiobiotin synthase [Ruminococcus sp.]